MADPDKTGSKSLFGLCGLCYFAVVALPFLPPSRSGRRAGKIALRPGKPLGEVARDAHPLSQGGERTGLVNKASGERGKMLTIV